VIIIKSKKGAIELSMTTIIIVVLGVMLLGLGIGWITNVLGKVDALTDQSFAQAQLTIQEQMPSNSDFYVAGYSFDVKAGKYTEIYTGAQFFDPDSATRAWFKIEVLPEDKASWFVTPEPQLANAGVSTALPVGVKVPSNIPRDLYSITFLVKKSDSATGPWEDYASSPVILKVE